jgi:acylphosphatase
MKHERLHLRITGRVQGVFYRASTEAKARELGLAGWVRNCIDGSVEAVSEGPRADLEALMSWCRQGPPAARVEGVEASWSEARGEFSGFEVRR